MGAKKIRKRVVGKTAPAPFLRAKPIEDGEDFNVYVEEIDNTFIFKDPHVVADFEATGLRLSRFPNTDTEAVFLWWVSKKSPQREDLAQDFAFQFADGIRDREIGSTLAKLAHLGHLRVMAIQNDAGVIIQMTPGSQEIN